jgi:class 3 adenylate cyclase
VDRAGTRSTGASVSRTCARARFTLPFTESTLVPSPADLLVREAIEEPKRGDARVIGREHAQSVRTKHLATPSSSSVAGSGSSTRPFHTPLANDYSPLSADDGTESAHVILFPAGVDTSAKEPAGADPAGSDGERPRSSGAEIRTFLIADVRGYTRFTQEKGDDAAGALAGAFAELTREVIEMCGGELIELRGDEALSVFSSARQAIRAAVELQKRFRSSDVRFPLGIGIGLDAGEAVPVAGGFRGGALNVAARLCGIAGPGEILATDTVTSLARHVDGVRVRERRAVRLKGLERPVRVSEARSQSVSAPYGSRTAWTGRCPRSIAIAGKGFAVGYRESRMPCPCGFEASPLRGLAVLRHGYLTKTSPRRTCSVRHEPIGKPTRRAADLPRSNDHPREPAFRRSRGCDLRR